MEQTPNNDVKTTPDDIFTITDLETLKAVSTPFRQNLMRLMAERPRTVKEMARELDMPPSRLYYHINQLEKRGIIRVAKTQIVSGIIEKHYQLAAKGFRVDRALLIPGSGQADAAIDALLTSTFDVAEKEIRQGLLSGAIDMRKRTPEPGAIFISHSLNALSPERYRSFLQRLTELFQEFEEADAAPEGADAYLTGILIAIYPTASPPPPDD
jgi:DNA-binding transcriptional ArsR family regulator